MGCARSGLFPLLLLSKLVSELDVLPGQFEVASPPHPKSCQHTNGQAPRRAWGTGGKGIELLSSTIKGLVRSKKDPRPSRVQVLGRILAEVCEHLSYSLGEPKKSRSSSHLTSIPTRKRYPIDIWPPEMPSLMF